MDYSDIIHLPHHTSNRHKRMSFHERAAQFAPFSALTGYATAIAEVGRHTDTSPVLEKDYLEHLNQSLSMLREFIKQKPAVSITYFEPDAHKNGGHYRLASGRLKNISEYEQKLTLVGGTQIRFNQIIDIKSAVLNSNV